MLLAVNQQHIACPVCHAAPLDAYTFRSSLTPIQFKMRQAQEFSIVKTVLSYIDEGMLIDFRNAMSVYIFKEATLQNIWIRLAVNYHWDELEHQLTEQKTKQHAQFDVLFDLAVNANAITTMMVILRISAVSRVKLLFLDCINKSQWVCSDVVLIVLPGLSKKSIDVGEAFIKACELKMPQRHLCNFFSLDQGSISADTIGEAAEMLAKVDNWTTFMLVWSNLIIDKQMVPASHRMKSILAVVFLTSTDNVFGEILNYDGFTDSQIRYAISRLEVDSVEFNNALNLSSINYPARSELLRMYTSVPSPPTSPSTRSSTFIDQDVDDLIAHAFDKNDFNPGDHYAFITKTALKGRWALLERYLLKMDELQISLLETAFNMAVKNNEQGIMALILRRTSFYHKQTTHIRCIEAIEWRCSDVFVDYYMVYKMYVNAGRPFLRATELNMPLPHWRKFLDLSKESLQTADVNLAFEVLLTQSNWLKLEMLWKSRGPAISEVSRNTRNLILIQSLVHGSLEFLREILKIKEFQPYTINEALVNLKEARKTVNVSDHTERLQLMQVYELIGR